MIKQIRVKKPLSHAKFQLIYVDTFRGGTWIPQVWAAQVTVTAQWRKLTNLSNQESLTSLDHINTAVWSHEGQEWCLTFQRPSPKHKITITQESQSHKPQQRFILQNTPNQHCSKLSNSSKTWSVWETVTTTSSQRRHDSISSLPQFPQLPVFSFPDTYYLQVLWHSTCYFW